MAGTGVKTKGETSYAIWHGESDGHCGYCNQYRRGSTSVSVGVTFTHLTAHVYQDLMDRGWRRCGTYVYKPIMDKTCCPQYTIRCPARELQLTKSQKKVIKKFNAFLLTPPDENLTPLKRIFKEDGDSSEEEDSSHLENLFKENDGNPSDVDIKVEAGGTNETVLTEPASTKRVSLEESGTEGISSNIASNSKRNKKNIPSINNNNVEMKRSDPEEAPSSSKGDLNTHDAEGSKPKCKKAKHIRLERRKAKLKKKGLSERAVEFKTPKNAEKTLEDLIHEVDSKETARKFTIATIKTDYDAYIKDHLNDFIDCYHLYAKYQRIIHNEPSTNPGEFRSFLVDSPLNDTLQDDSAAESHGLGTYHQLYRVDGKLIAVGVIDILPRGVSSVYFIHDPDYLHLSLGTYGAARELEYVRRNCKYPTFKYYYMGYYIHSCQKMRYKAQWKPSFLLCPEAYTYHPISECLNKLDLSPYSRLNEDPDGKSSDFDADVDEIQLATGDGIVRVRDCDWISGDAKKDIIQFARLAGGSATQKIILHHHHVQ